MVALEVPRLSAAHRTPIRCDARTRAIGTTCALEARERDEYLVRCSRNLRTPDHAIPRSRSFGGTARQANSVSDRSRRGRVEPQRLPRKIGQLRARPTVASSGHGSPMLWTPCRPVAHTSAGDVFSTLWVEERVEAIVANAQRIDLSHAREYRKPRLRRRYSRRCG